ncbi:MAG: CDP-glycerol glycerophosphotransferase family protein [Micrococcales bacterium]
MNLISKLAAYSPKRVISALVRRRADLIRKLQYQPGKSELRDAVLFESFEGKVIGDSPLDIFRELQSRGTTLELIWTTGPNTVAPAGARAVRHGSRDWLEALATSKYLVNNNTFPWYFRKSPGQIYLQTWHGTPLKRLGRDIANGSLTKSYLDLMQREVAAWDYLVSPSTFFTESFSSAFGYTGNVLEVGYPRNDRLSTAVEITRNEIRRKLGVHEQSSILVLYAPTWRNYERSATGSWRSVNYLDDQAELPPGYRLVFRGHTNTHATHRVHTTAIDATHYPDVTELYLACDVLVTDYSSMMFDFSITGKPMLFLAPDLDRYKNEQGFYFDFESEAPGPILNNQDEVLRALDRIDQISLEYQARYRDWQKRFNALEDGKAAARVVDAVFGN